MKHILALLFLVSVTTQAATLAEIKANLAKLEKSIGESEKGLAGMIVAQTTVRLEIAKGCDIDMVKFRAGTLSAGQERCARTKFSNRMQELKVIDGQVKSNDDKVNSLFGEYNDLLKSSKRELKPEEITDLLATATLLGRTQTRATTNSLRAQMFRDDLNRQKKDFEDSLEYAFTSNTIQNTLNSPLLCKSVARCPSDEVGTLSTSDIKKNIIDGATTGTIRKINAKKQSPSGASK